MSSASSKTLLVIGATGNQGNAVLRYFAEHRPDAFRLRGITRNPDSEASRALQSLGVEMLKADANSTSSLKSAFTAVTHIFANTDSNQLVHAAARDPSVLGAGQTPLTYATEIEEQQGRNIIEAAAATSTLERIIWSSIASPKKWTKGRLDKALMFDSKENIADLFWTDPVVKGKTSVLLVGFYVSNALHMPQVFGPQKQGDGVYQLSLPMSGDSPQAIADLDSDLGSWAEALFEAAAGTTLLGASETMTWAQWTQAWCAANGVHGRFQQVSGEVFAPQLGPMGEATVQALKFVEEQTLAGGIPRVLLPEDLRKQDIAIQTTPIAEAMRRIDWSGVL